MDAVDPRLIAELTAELDAQLAAADAELAARFPGERPGRQPIHTVYVPADRFTADIARHWGTEALETIDAHLDTWHDLVADDTVSDLVRAKLASEPIEDLRIDFEDGYGNRGDDVEDADVTRAARALADAQSRGTATELHGIRFKSFEAPTRARSVRTLVGFVSEVVANGGSLDRFVTTLPKVTSVDQVRAMVHVSERLESVLDLAAGILQFEIQVETPQSILGPDGTALVAPMIQAGAGRVTSFHYGTYDYSAYSGIAAEYQSLEHPVADHAKLVMQAAAAGTGVRLSDGSTNILPVGDDETVRAAWRLHHRLVGRSLERGYYQGWDLHPAQLPTRYAATFAFYRNGFERAARRLRDYLAQVGGSVQDEPATARALSDFIGRGRECGAITAHEVESGTGLDEHSLMTLARPTRS
ncbi:aldolase [Knoellia sinensis KCTC 19936]|uniref:Aldolase n=1 Tax=Knoellia sinensis KCTC 19936 TaxID=1385520 RepID=A0A0A0JDP0_9MICO|nr:aldolase [Knoellia sinensis]KGN34147.1 aldolase [Knoellia sinensis KCTC 19936]